MVVQFQKSYLIHNSVFFLHYVQDTQTTEKTISLITSKTIRLITSKTIILITSKTIILITSKIIRLITSKTSVKTTTAR